MNAHTFEHQLRQATVPTPDAAAKHRAMSAALAEFHRVHAAANQTIAPEASWLVRLRSFVLGTGRGARSPRLVPGAGHSGRSRNLWLGGLATACVVVVAVSTFFLVPPGQRQVRVRPGIPVESNEAVVRNPTLP